MFDTCKKTSMTSLFTTWFAKAGCKLDLSGGLAGRLAGSKLVNFAGTRLAGSFRSACTKTCGGVDVCTYNYI